MDELLPSKIGLMIISYYFIGHEPRIREDEPISMAHGSWNVKCFRLVVAHIATQEQTSLACAGGLSKDVNLQLANPKQPFDGVLFFSETETCVQNRQATSVGISNY